MLRPITTTDLDIVVQLFKVSEAALVQAQGDVEAARRQLKARYLVSAEAQGTSTDALNVINELVDVSLNSLASGTPNPFGTTDSV